jgi:hypothetical protein
MSLAMTNADLQCLEHRCRFIWTVSIAEGRRGGEIEDEISKVRDRMTSLRLGGKNGGEFWATELFELDNQNALLPHIAMRFATPSAVESGAAQRLRLTETGRSQFASVRLVLFGSYRKPKDGKRPERDFARVVDAQVIFLPDATVACVLDLVVGQVTEAEEGNLPKVSQPLEKSPAAPTSDTQSRRAKPIPVPSEVLERVLCDVRRGLEGRRKYTTPMHAGESVPVVVGDGGSRPADSLGDLLRKLAGRPADGDKPTCLPFMLSDLSDGLFASVWACDSGAARARSPMLYTMVRVPDPSDSGEAARLHVPGRVRDLAFRLANGFNRGYRLSASGDGLVLRSPLQNRYFAATRNGATAVCLDDGAEFHAHFMARLSNDYFLVYLVALHQRHQMLELNLWIASTITRADLRGGTLDKNKDKRLRTLRRQMQEFLTHTRARQVSDYVLHAQAYACFWEALGLDDLYSSAGESIKELNDYFERRREDRKQRIVDALMFVGLPVTIASTVFGFNLTEFKTSLEHWGDTPVLIALLSCVLFALAMGLTIFWVANKHKGD